MARVTCPHCGEVNEEAGRFCESCGQALPVGDGSPRVFEHAEDARTEGGRALQSDALRSKVKTARGGLLAVAILQLIGGVIFYFLLRDNPLMDEGQVLAVVGVMGVLSALYFGLWAWAKRSPFPAALVGLIVFVTLWVAEAAMDPSQLYRGILIKGIIVLVLGRAVAAGVQYRRLQHSAAGGTTREGA